MKGDLINAHKHLKVDVKVMGPASAAQQQNKGSRHKLEYRKFHLTVRISSFT